MFENTSVLNAMQRHLSLELGQPDFDLGDISQTLEVVQVDAKHNLQAIGQPITEHYYVTKGLVRLFYLTPEGKELNKAFYGENHIVGNLSAVILNENSRFAVETLEPCTLVKLPMDRLQECYKNSAPWQSLFNYGCQMMLIRNERREAELLTMNARQRFLQFTRNFPEYLERIPQYHIASYLGITPEALSKYKKQWLKSDQ